MVLYYDNSKSCLFISKKFYVAPVEVENNLCYLRRSQSEENKFANALKLNIHTIFYDV
jgi:hypothetical protein